MFENHTAPHAFAETNLWELGKGRESRAAPGVRSSVCAIRREDDPSGAAPLRMDRPDIVPLGSQAAFARRRRFRQLVIRAIRSIVPSECPE